jgi:hypothetical protein
MQAAVRQTAELFNAMSLQDLTCYVNCPGELQDNFEKTMREKYNLPQEVF